jgi:hypothetical protein
LTELRRALELKFKGKTAGRHEKERQEIARKRNGKTVGRKKIEICFFHRPV